MTGSKVKTTVDLSELLQFIDAVKKQEHPESYLIAILHRAQELYGYLSQEVMDAIALQMNIPTAHIWGVATFYHYFNLKPRGKYRVSVCLGTACYIKGAQDILNTLQDNLQVPLGETTEDRLFTLQSARCLGACGIAPVIMVEDKIYGSLTPKKVIEIIKYYRKLADK
ncbi:MAG: NADH-quinone oxidoreductase subunit NuoE [bacterium]|nr:NADH-quinone oxidoreductase subunit NuoE [bacterium]